MPNSQGSNQFDRFASQSRHGEVKKATQLSRAAPISGAPTAALNAPRRLQKQAARGQKPGSAAASPAPPPPPPVEAPYRTQLAAVWSELAASAPDDELLSYYAATAQRQALG